jgi:hypothetical protein
MRSVEATTDIMYPVNVNTSNKSNTNGYGEDSVDHSGDIGIAHRDHELGPKIHLMEWTWSRGHVNESDCNDINCDHHEAQWIFF